MSSSHSPTREETPRAPRAAAAAVSLRRRSLQRSPRVEPGRDGCAAAALFPARSGVARPRNARTPSLESRGLRQVPLLQDLQRRGLRGGIWCRGAEFGPDATRTLCPASGEKQDLLGLREPPWGDEQLPGHRICPVSRGPGPPLRQSPRLHTLGWAIFYESRGEQQHAGTSRGQNSKLRRAGTGERRLQWGRNRSQLGCPNPGDFFLREGVPWAWQSASAGRAGERGSLLRDAPFAPVLPSLASPPLAT